MHWHNAQRPLTLMQVKHRMFVAPFCLIAGPVHKQAHRYVESDDEEEDAIDDEVYAQKMQEQLNSSRPRRAAAMQATASMMVRAFVCTNYTPRETNRQTKAMHDLREQKQKFP